MSLYFKWQEGTIASSGTSTDEIDLGDNCDFMNLILPALTSGTIKIQVTDISDGTYSDLGSSIVIATTTGSFSTTLNLGGYRWIKVVSSASQGAARTIKCRGWKM